VPMPIVTVSAAAGWARVSAAADNRIERGKTWRTILILIALDALGAMIGGGGIPCKCGLAVPVD
jgi:hypothetical protein